MKSDSTIIIYKLQSGTTLFTISVVLMMVSSYLAGRYKLLQQDLDK